MRGRSTLILVLFIVLIPGIIAVVLLQYSPSTVHDIVNSLTNRLFPGAGSPELAYSIVVYGAFVYVIILVSVILYLILSVVVKQLAMSDN